MAPPPWNSKAELDAALERGDLRFAITLAEKSEPGKPIRLPVAARFLPLIAGESPQELDAWACRWLARWLAETPAMIDQAAELAAHLADLPAEPAAFDMIMAAA